MYDHEPTQDELDDAMVEDTVHCARCNAAYTVTETFGFDDRSVCFDCAQDEIDELTADRARLSAELAAAVDVLTPVDQASGGFFAATGRLCPFAPGSALELDGPFGTDAEAIGRVRALIRGRLSDPLPRYQG